MSDITKSYIEAYLKAIRPLENGMITDMESYAKEHHVPIIKYDARAVLQNLIRIHHPKTILEIGTAIGYSAISMLEIYPDIQLVTIEKNADMINEAKKNFEKFGVVSRVEVLEGDSDDILPHINESYDMIFLDAAKGQYLPYLDHCLRLLNTGGLLISDNVLQGGYIAKSKWSIPRRQRTIHSRMREYLWTLNHHESLRTSILPVSDGLTISIKVK